MAKLDASDNVAWRNSLGESGRGLAADGDGNNQIDSGDYLVWRAHFGQTAGSTPIGSSSNAPVPEQVTWVMLLSGMLAVRSRRHAVMS